MSQGRALKKWAMAPSCLRMSHENRLDVSARIVEAEGSWAVRHWIIRDVVLPAKKLWSANGSGDVCGQFSYALVTRSQVPEEAHPTSGPLSASQGYRLNGHRKTSGKIAVVSIGYCSPKMRPHRTSCPDVLCGLRNMPGAMEVYLGDMLYRHPQARTTRRADLDD